MLGNTLIFSWLLRVYSFVQQFKECSVDSIVCIFMNSLSFFLFEFRKQRFIQNTHCGIVSLTWRSINAIRCHKKSETVSLLMSIETVIETTFNVIGYVESIGFCYIVHIEVTKLCSWMKLFTLIPVCINELGR